MAVPAEVTVTQSALQRRQYLIFSVGWFAYAATYLLRKPLGVIKADLETDLSFSKNQLGWLDTALFLPYAVMQMLLSPVGDRFGPRKTFGVSLILAAISMISFGMWSNYYVFLVLLFLNGSAQAQCWPCCGKSLMAWFPDNIRNTVFGYFGTCAFVGGILGTSLSVYLQGEFGWRSVFLAPSICVGVLGGLVLILYSQPDELGIKIPGKEEKVISEEVGTRLTWLQLWKIPAVAELSVAMFCLKVVRYCMYMWMPMYLLRELGYSRAMSGLFSTMFEVGGVIGCACTGKIIDRYFPSRPLLGTSIFVSLSTLFLLLFYLTSNWGVPFNSTFMILAGMFNSGPDVILGGSMPAELGEMNGRRSSAAVVGLVNGFGSMGTFLEGPIIGFVTSMWGWSYMFHLLVGLSLAGAVSVYKADVSHSSRHENPGYEEGGGGGANDQI